MGDEKGIAMNINYQVVRKTDIFLRKLNSFLNKEVHIKLEADENPVSYILKEMGKDFLVVDYGESQRIIPIDKITFVQIGSYPKELT